MRSFIAINRHAEIKEYLHCLTLDLQKQNPQVKVKWVEKHNLHLTLFFLGQVNQEHLDQLAAGIKSQLSFEPFTLTTKQLGTFPPNREPRVLKISLIGNHDLQNICDIIKNQLIKSKLRVEDRPFSPHITLGRIKQRVNNYKLIKDIKAVEFQVDSIDVMASNLTADGPQYSIISKIQ
jgi:2'-5' RNA ligase